LPRLAGGPARPDRSVAARMRKNSLMRALTISVAMTALLTCAAPASAETLAEALTSAVEGNPTLAAQRQRLAASREALPQAWAEALPQLSLSANAGVSDRFPTAGDTRDESWSGSASASQLLFASGRVLATTRAAKAEIRGAVADYDLAEQNLLLSTTSAY